MKTQVEFRSRKFPPYEDEEEQINPGLWGKRLAEYLVQKLAEKGIQTDPIIAEDWGWYAPSQICQDCRKSGSELRKAGPLQDASRRLSGV